MENAFRVDFSMFWTFKTERPEMMSMNGKVCQITNRFQRKDGQKIFEVRFLHNDKVSLVSPDELYLGK